MMKRHRRTVELIGFEVTIIHQDRADSSNVTSHVCYFEAENISDVYRHIIKTYSPEWIDHVPENHHVAKEWYHLDEMTHDELEEYFEQLYDKKTQEFGGDYVDKYTISVCEWEAPTFERI